MEAVGVGVVPPSIWKMISEDHRAQAGFLTLFSGLLFIPLTFVFGYHVTPPRGLHEGGYILLAFGCVLAAVGAVVLSFRASALKSVFSNGQLAIGRVLGVTTGALGGSGTSIEVTYEFMGQTYRGKLVAPYIAPLKAGHEVGVIVDPERPERFLIRESYLTKGGLSDEVTMVCQVCRADIPGRLYFNHMKAVHPGEWRHTKLLILTLASVVSAAVAAGVIAVVIWGEDWKTAAMILVGVASVILTMAITDALGTNSEKRARAEWLGSRSNLDRDAEKGADASTSLRSPRDRA